MKVAHDLHKETHEPGKEFPVRNIYHHTKLQIPICKVIVILGLCRRSSNRNWFRISRNTRLLPKQSVEVHHSAAQTLSGARRLLSEIAAAETRGRR